MLVALCYRLRFLNRFLSFRRFKIYPIDSSGFYPGFSGEESYFHVSENGLPFKLSVVNDMINNMSTSCLVLNNYYRGNATKIIKLLRNNFIGTEKLPKNKINRPRDTKNE